MAHFESKCTWNRLMSVYKITQNVYLLYRKHIHHRVRQFSILFRFYCAMGIRFFTIVSSRTLSLTIVPLLFSLCVTNPGIFIYHTQTMHNILRHVWPQKYLSVSKNGSAYFDSRKVQNIIFNISPRLRSHFFLHKSLYNVLYLSLFRFDFH